VTLILGVVIVIAPWLMGFAALNAATGTFVVLGAVIALASISELWTVHHPQALGK
jgi:SPW repeat